MSGVIERESTAPTRRLKGLICWMAHHIYGEPYEHD